MSKQLLFIFLLLANTVCRAQIDTTIGLTAPKNISRDYNALAAHLCFDQQDEQAKVNAIYNWVTHNISYDVKSLKKFPKHRDDVVDYTLKNRKAVCEGYAMVFTEICRAAGLKAVNIEGYAKDWIFDNGDELYIPRHMWSAVMVNGRWQLYDPTWGAGVVVQSPGWVRRVRNRFTRHKVMYAKNLKFRYKYDTTYYMQNPEAFRLKHLPSDPLWQLTDTIMPLQVFEAGDSAINAFNTLYSKPMQTNPELARISTFDEQMKVFNYADRAYTYNNRYPTVLALKYANQAGAVLQKAFTDTTLQTPELLIKDAATTLQKSQVYLKEQKKTFPEEYSKLKKKNKIKNQAAKKYIREIKTDDKRLLAECKKYERSATNKYNRIKKKSAAAQKRKQGTDAGKIDDIATAKTEKKAGAPELNTLKDSVSNRNTRLAELKQLITGRQDTIQHLQLANAKLLDSLGKAITYEDSMLVLEAGERLAMHDSYDDEVLMWSRQFKEMKYKHTDSLQKHYMAGFDTITNAYDALQKTQVAVLDIYKKDIATLEQYKKWNSSDNTVPDQYAACVAAYISCIDLHDQDLVQYAEYLKANKKLFAGLEQLSKRQIKITEYMEHAERTRKMLEEKTIAKKQTFDLKENRNQTILLQDIQGKVNKIADKL